MKRKKKRKKNNHDKKNREIMSILFISFGIICVLSLHSNSVGKFGSFLKNILLGLFANSAYILPYMIIVFGILYLNNTTKKTKIKVMLNFLVVFFCLQIFYSVIYRQYIPDIILHYNSLKVMYYLGLEGIGGGICGSILSSFFLYLFGVKGTYIIIATIIIFLIILNTNLSLSNLINYIFNNISKKIFTVMVTFFSKLFRKRDYKYNSSHEESNNKTVEDVKEDLVDKKIKILDYTNINNNEKSSQNFSHVQELKIDNFNSNNATNSHNQEDNDEITIDKTNSLIDYKLPNINLLKLNEKNYSKKDKKDILIKAKVLEDTLNNFGVDAKVVQISKGPTITRFEIQPSPGVKVSKIVNLSDDIALSLAAQNIRIEAPIPGKSAIGIEVPNDNNLIVTLREVIESEVFQSNSSKLTMALGKDISGNPIVADLAKMPHMLIAGATGSGKSVCVNTLITSILYKASPDDVRFLLIDPKVVELSNYNGIPHLLLPVVTDPKKAATALNWVVQEMTHRYKLFAQNSVRDLDSYNKKLSNSQSSKLPKLVVIIDELADLMMVAPNQVEDSICRIAQMARAAGIHLIVATQRPSVDVITGVIKANIPSRIAFAVSSQADSRTILDMAGAEKLLGRGDMLFYPVGSSKPIRIQGAFISDSEVAKVVEFIKKQVDSQVEYNEEIITNVNNNVINKETDELLPEAIEMVVEAGQASISMLQRRLRIGYNRAARLIDEMEERGIVSENLGSKPRQVLISREEYEDIKGKTS